MPTPSLILVPARFKSGKLYTQVATTTGGVVLGSSGDFTVGRLLDTATRVNSNGNIEVVNANIPRLDYYTSGGTAGCPALLVEPAATNLVLHSRDLANIVWLTTGITAAKNAVGADGTASGATTLTATAASGIVLQALVNVSQSRVFSAYIRRVSGTGAIQLTTNGGTNWDTVTISSLYTQVSCTAQTVLNGSVGIRMAVSGDVIEVDFTQGEVGPVATSPIATTIATGTRNADVINLSGAVSGCIGQTQGTIYAEVDIQFNNRNADIIGLDSGSSANGFYLIMRDSSVIELRVRRNSTNELIFQRTGGAYPVGINKIAVSYKNGDFAISLNGTTTQVNTSTITMPSVAITRASVVPSINFTLDQSVRVRAAAIYPTRLSNTDLALLTA
jgi:hypothetical protein